MSDSDDPRRVHPVVDRLTAYAWRLLVLTAAGVGILWLVAQLWVVLLALVVAFYLARLLDTPAQWLARKGAPSTLASVLAMGALFGALALLGWAVVPRMVDQFDSLQPTLSQAIDDVETWLVEDSPLGVDRQDLDDLREQLGDAASTALRSSGGTLVNGAVLAVEALTGLLLGLVTTFFFLKDGPRLQRWSLRFVPTERRHLATRLGARAWSTLGGYLRGVAILGTLEGAIIGVTIALVGGELAWPVALLTFLAAFVPIAGAVVAGLVAILVTLATSGVADALIVGVVALVVQQLDNDFLAPVIYGRSLQLHPLAVLFSLVGGGALFGFAGTVLAVPITAIAVNMAAEAKAVREEERAGG
jgi:predicted PurR-regulated permease PerM